MLALRSARVIVRTEYASLRSSFLRSITRSGRDNYHKPTNSARAPVAGARPGGRRGDPAGARRRRRRDHRGDRRGDPRVPPADGRGVRPRRARRDRGDAAPVPRAARPPGRRRAPGPRRLPRARPRRVSRRPRGSTRCSSAYRVGARVAWRRISEAAIAAGLEGQTLALLAESIFAYIDEISAESVEGYASAQAASAGERSRERQAFVRLLVAGDPDGAEAQAAAARRLAAAAARSRRSPPTIATPSASRRSSARARSARASTTSSACSSATSTRRGASSASPRALDGRLAALGPTRSPGAGRPRAGPAPRAAWRSRGARRAAPATG